MGTGDTYIYPDSSPTHYSNGRGQSFLRSPIVSVWKQPITADTFLYESGMSGVISSAGLKVTGKPADTEGLAVEKGKMYNAGNLVYVSYSSDLTTPVQLSDFFVWKYWLKDPDQAQPQTDQGFSTEALDARLIAYVPPKANSTTGEKAYGLLFFESSTTSGGKSMTTNCGVTVQQRLFADDDSYQNNYIASNNTWDNWYCGDENNSYTIAYRANRAKASVVSLIGGAERTTRVSRRVDMSALQWKVSMVNNVAELTVSDKTKSQLSGRYAG